MKTLSLILILTLLSASLGSSLSIEKVESEGTVGSVWILEADEGEEDVLGTGEKVLFAFSRLTFEEVVFLLEERAALERDIKRSKWMFPVGIVIGSVIALSFRAVIK